MKIRRFFRALALLPCLITVTLPAAAQTELIVNGGFETGNFAGWQRFVQAGSPGNFQIAADMQTPSEEFPTPSPSAGSFYAVTDSNFPGTDGPSAYALIQTFSVPTFAMVTTLRFDMFVNDWFGAGALNTGGALDYTQETPTQFARVDLLRASATPFSVEASEIVGNFFIGLTGTEPPYPYTAYNIDLTPLVVGGQTYQLRFASVANQFSLNQGVDNVSVLTSIAPEPSGFFLCLVCGVFLVPLVRHRRN